MRRLCRIFFNAAVVVSLAMFLTVAVLWSVSHTRTLWISYGRGDASYQLIRMVDGVILIGRVMLPHSNPQGLSGGTAENPTVDRWLDWPTPTLANRFGFGLIFDGSTRRAAPWDVRIVMFPLWMVFFVMAILPTLKLIAWRRARHRREVEPEAMPCPACGYDLRATPERCPECGAVPATDNR